MVNLNEDVSKLTTISEATLNQLDQRKVWCIAEAVTETALSEKSSIDLNIGIGVLSLLVEDNQVKYKFKPSTNLDEAIKGCLIHKQNALSINLDKALVDKLTNIYKNLV